MKKAIVTGASGFIGRVLQLKLKEAGYYVIGVDVKCDNYDWNTDEFFIDNYATIASDGDLDGVDAIFHLGANSLLGPSVSKPLYYYDNNVSSMCDMLSNLARENWKGAFIFASSAATYGDMRSPDPLPEVVAGSPINPYGSTKWVGEMMLKESCEAYGLKAYSMRFFNVAGAYKGIGQAANQPHILTKMSKASLTDDTFYINGNEYDTFDGTCVRDYIHVADVCDALVAAAEQLYNKPEREYDTFNVCSGKPVSNLQLALTFAKLYPLEYDIAEVRPGDPGFLIGDPYKLSLMWPEGPKYDLADIITSHFESISSQMLVGQPWLRTYDGKLQ
jgi:UDP-glucose 4-epimerase